MPVVKGGVWTNIEDEILKAAVSKYGLNQWARVSSLLARKTAKQCKARWAEWLDPGIRKIEWSKEEDEKLLHLAKLMPTQWRTIAPIVGRTATQCLERYQKLLDEAEARENDELGLGGPAGGETAAPSADDVRRLRPGELDPDPESKPARPDTIDLDEDEKEMLSEARARLANTQGKKAKRKARERQLEESRRLANLQKRRELKTAGINVKVTTRKAGEMDYNADIPFEKAPAPGFYDTQTEDAKNEREREMFDPRRQQLANKRKGDQQDDDNDDRKRQKNDKNQASAASAAAQKAGQMQKIREAERSTKRRALNLPAPQVGEGEIEDIVKMGMAGQRASQAAGSSENEATRSLIGNYNNMVGNTPIRTPRAPQEEDRVANEIRNARARTETQSALLGGDNAELLDGDGTTGYTGAAPSKQSLATPNPLATPLRQNGVNGTPAHPSATPSRTPRDTFRLNDQTPSQALTGQTPREIKLARASAQNNLKARLASLPAPKETSFELELPEEQQEVTTQPQLSEEDAAIRDARNAEIRAAAEREEFKRQTQSYQKGLPRPTNLDLDALLEAAKSLPDTAEQAIATEAALLVAHDARTFSAGRAKVKGPVRGLQQFSDQDLQGARMEIALELDGSGALKGRDSEAFDVAWDALHDTEASIPGLGAYASDDEETSENEPERLRAAFDNILGAITSTAESSAAVEKKLAVHLGGYQARSRTLRTKIGEAHEALEKTRSELEVARTAAVAEDVAVRTRLEGLRDEVDAVSKRERRAQAEWKEWKDRLEELA